MTRVIAVTGGKGGVGKTNISLNLALVLAKLGIKVCLFDADLGLANINILLGLYPEYDLEDVILNNKSVNEILIRNYQGIDIIPGSSGVEKLANLGQDDIDRIVEAFSKLDVYDYFILDTSAGISRSVISFCLAASDVALVITPEPTSLTDAYALLKVLCFNGFRGSPKVIVNQCKNTTVASTAYNKLKEVVQKYLTLDIVPLGIIIRDKKFPEAVQRQQPLVSLYPQSGAAKCLNVIASRLLANQSESFRQTGLATFWARFLEITKTPLKLPEKTDVQQKEIGAVEPEETVCAPQPEEDIALELQDIQPPQPAAPADRQNPQPAAPASHEPPAETPKPQQPRFSRTAKKELFEKLEHTINLPTLPHILIRVIQACGNEDTDLRDLAKIIEKDPSLCARILRMVNSAHYSFSQKISNFNQALSLLGFDTIRNIAISASVYQVFNGMNRDGAFNLKLFWWHSLMCAVLSELIAKKISYARPEEAFLAGLLHDIGKPLLAKNYPDQYGAILQEALPPEQAVLREDEQLGVAHNQAGAWLINRWHLHPFIADAILYHHEPAARIVHALPLVKIVYTANSLSAVQPGTSAQSYEAPESIFSFTPEEIDALLLQAGEQVGQIAQSFDIAIETSREQACAIAEKDREIQTQLVRQVRDISLLQGTLQQFVNATDSDTLLHSAYQGLEVLFDIKNTHALFFLHDTSQNIFIGKTATTATDHNTVNELTIPNQNGKTMVSMALKQARSINSFDHGAQYELTIIDEQLIRVLGREGIVCFPMLAHGSPVGAGVIGVDKRSLAQVQADTKLLTMFFSQLALALDAENIRQTQAKNILAERLAASTSIARKVAHEVNNPLSIIKNYLKVMEIKLADHDMATDELTIINEEIDRVAAIVDDLSDFSQPKIQTLATVYINALLSDIVKITGQALRQQKINITFAPDGTLPPVISDKNGLKQVFINLIKNAAEALRDGGTIAIATRYSADRGAAEITIQDDGPGLPEAVRDRLFEPYISTKGRGHSGLGLSIVYGTVQELQGTITCTTEKGHGTTFIIVLPVASSQSNIFRRA